MARLRAGRVCAALLGILLWRPSPAPAAEEDAGTVGRARFLMGTRLSIRLPSPAGEAAFEAAFAEVARLETVLSNWDESSEISRLNREAAAAPFRCSPDLFGIVRAALHWAEATEGAFDPTVEPLVRALGLRDPADRMPEAVEAPQRREGLVADRGASGSTSIVIGWRHVRLEASSRAVSFDAPGVGLDLGGIGKGFALDAAARLLKGRGFRSMLLDFGGQVLAIGFPPGGETWPVGIAAPGRRAEAATWIGVRDRSVSTSGNDERHINGPEGPIGHILDPALRAPARYAGSVTVVTPDATTADALSTGLFVMGPDRGGRWADARGVAALFLWRRPDGSLARWATRAFDVLASTGMADRGAAGIAPQEAPAGGGHTPCE